MTDMMNRAIQGGVALVVVVILATGAVSMANDYDYTETFSIDNETEWNNNANTLTGVVVNADGYVMLDSGNTSGTYSSVSISENATRWTVDVSLPDADNSSVSLTVDGSTYDLTDGANEVTVDNEVSSYQFDLDFSRDSTSVTSPQVNSVTSYTGEESFNSQLIYFAFAILMIMVVAMIAQRVM